MAHAVRVWIIEEQELRGTKLSCVPRSLPSGASQGSCAWFNSQESLVQAVHAAFTQMLRAEDGARHILVLSAHGKEMTGTHIEVSKNTHIRLDAHADLFAIRPRGLVTLVSACWSGYPSVLQALRAGEGTEATLIVASLVNIHPDDINAVQADVIAAMVREEQYDEVIERIVVGHDAKLRQKHAEPVLRIVRRDGTMVPAAGEAGLAAPMEDLASYRVVALHRLPAPNGEPPGNAILQAPDGTYWRAAVPTICDADSDAEVYALQGRVITLRGKRLKYDDGVGLGELVEIVTMTDPPKVKARPMPTPPYSHSAEQTVAKTVKEARQVGARSLKRCKRCNWASFSFKSVKQNGTLRHNIQAICHRDSCDEHGKWAAPG